MDLHWDYLRELANEYREDGLDVQTNVIWDRPLHDGIVRYACSSQADIVFKDTHRHPGLGLSGLSNTDWSLMRACPMPLWLVKPFDYPDSPQIISALDPMHEHDKPAALDHEIIHLAQSIAEVSRGNVHAFHSFDTSGFESTRVSEEPVRQLHNDCLTTLAREHQIPASRTHFASGCTHETLPNLVAEIDASLVVMGAVARTRLKRLFIGSTAEQTLDRIACDLLVVKPDWFVTPVGTDEID